MKNKTKTVLKVQRVLMPIFEISSTPTISLKDLKVKRFYLKEPDGVLMIYDRDPFEGE